MTEDDLAKMVRKLVAKAKAGERWAVVELLDRLVGRDAVLTQAAQEAAASEAAKALAENEAEARRDGPDDYVPMSQRPNPLAGRQPWESPAVVDDPPRPAP